MSRLYLNDYNIISNRIDTKYQLCLRDNIQLPTLFDTNS